MKYENKYNLGLDIGVGSIGWSIVEIDENDNPCAIIDTGVVIVESMEDEKGNLKNADRRGYRGTRRTLQRRNHRVKRVKSLINRNFSNIDFQTLFDVNQTSVYELKVKGLSEKLTEDELARVLIHYAKHRGYKSNRKNEKKSADGKVLVAIEENIERLNGRYISQLLLEELNGINKIKNSTKDDYKYSFLREEYEKEIKAVLTTQVENNLINEDFKDEYLTIWASQRHFSDGPGGDSPYKVNFANVFGICSFDNNLRAPKASISQQYNTTLLKLVNLRYRYRGEHYFDKRLTLEQVNKLMQHFEKEGTLKYSEVTKVLAVKGGVEYKNVNFSQDEFKKVVKKFKEKNNLDPKANIDFTLPEFIEFKNKELEAKIIFNKSTNKILKKAVDDILGNGYFDTLPLEYKDDIVTCLTFYKTDERIRNYFLGNETDTDDVTSQLDWDLYPEFVNDALPFLTMSFKESSALSLEILRQLNQVILRGKTCNDNTKQNGELVALNYDEAMKELGYNHSERNNEIVRVRKIKDLKKLLDEQYPNEISNPRVIRVLSRTTSVINALIDRYGMPKYIHIEMARDINLKSTKRTALLKQQLNNLNINESIKAEIIVDHPNMKYSEISKQDIEKYKLYYEQDGLCAYTLKPIDKRKILTRAYQIDHIIPYSISHMNTMLNKTLVTEKANQDKTNMIPLDYFRNKNKSLIDEFKSFITNNPRISKRKKEIYLLNSVSDFKSEFGENALNDTRFITSYLVDILKNNLAFVDDQVQVPVVPLKAGYVNYFKKANNISYLTHSLENSEYKKETNIVIKSLDYKLTLPKNKDKGINKYEFNLKVIDTISNKEYEANATTVKINDKTPVYIIKLNEILQTVFENISKIDLAKIENTDLTPTKENDYKIIIDHISDFYLDKELKIYLIELLTHLKSEIDKKLIKKNRDNHLHHALDAIAVASLTRSVQQKLSKYDKERYDILEKIEKEGTVTLETSEGTKVVKSLADFKKIEEKLLNVIIPAPFENFKTEVKAFVYERDNEIQKQMVPNREIRVLNPVITKKKRYSIVDGKMTFSSLHKETILGRSGESLTKKIGVDKLTNKNIDKIIGKDTYAKPTYEACKKWMETKSKDKYPTLKNGREIKKIKISETEVNGGYYLGDNRNGYAKGDDVVCIELYKKHGEDRIYYVQRNAMNLSQEQEGRLERLIFWYGRDNNNIEYIFNDKYTIDNLYSEYKLITKLYPGDLVHLIKSDGKNANIVEADVYITGFTGGKLEVQSIIGDSFDIKCYLNINSNTQNFISVSTIKSIQKINQNILGYRK